MSTARDAHRALSRGDIDLALVLLWNAVEPHRLEGDRASLEAIEQMAETIAEVGDTSQAREGARLADEVSELLADESTVESAASFGADHGGHAEQVTVTIDTVADESDDEGFEDEEFEDDGGLEYDTPERPDTPERSKLTGLVWAIIIGVFILINVLGNFLRD